MTEMRAPLPPAAIRLMRRFVADRSGATAVEYAVVALISVAIIIAVGQLGDATLSLYDKVAELFAD